MNQTYLRRYRSYLVNLPLPMPCRARPTRSNVCKCYRNTSKYRASKVGHISSRTDGTGETRKTCEHYYSLHKQRTSEHSHTLRAAAQLLFRLERGPRNAFDLCGK